MIAGPKPKHEYVLTPEEYNRLQAIAALVVTTERVECEYMESKSFPEVIGSVPITLKCEDGKFGSGDCPNCQGLSYTERRVPGELLEALAYEICGQCGAKLNSGTYPIGACGHCKSQKNRETLAEARELAGLEATDDTE